MPDTGWALEHTKEQADAVFVLARLIGSRGSSQIIPYSLRGSNPLIKCIGTRCIECYSRKGTQGGRAFIR